MPGFTKAVLPFFCSILIAFPSQANTGLPEDCVPLTAHTLQQDAAKGQWRYYRDPFDLTHCLLISYQQIWDTSKPTHLQVMPVNLPENVKPYLTRHGLLKNTLPDNGKFKSHWLHLGYAEDRDAHQHYLAILKQPALADRVNEVMTWQHLIARAPRPAHLSDVEYLAYQDTAIALLLAYPDLQKHSKEMIQAIKNTRDTALYYRYLDALYALRYHQGRNQVMSHHLTSSPSHLPSQGDAVYARLQNHFNTLSSEPVMTLPDALRRAEQLIRRR